MRNPSSSLTGQSIEVDASGLQEQEIALTVCVESEGVLAHLSVIDQEYSGLWLEVSLSHPDRKAGWLTYGMTPLDSNEDKTSYLMLVCQCIRKMREGNYVSDSARLQDVVAKIAAAQPMGSAPGKFSLSSPDPTMTHHVLH